MKFVLSSLLLFFLIDTIQAEVFYVRGLSGEYGAEDGTTYETAFDGPLDIAWGSGAGQVGAGDTLYFCDTWVYSTDSGSVGADFNTTTNALSTGASGTAGNVITIRGDLTDHTFKLINARKITSAGWTDLLDGSYSKTITNSGAQSGGWEGDPDATQTSSRWLHNKTSAAEVAATDGSFWLDIAASPDICYYNPTGAGAPSQSIYIAFPGRAITNHGEDYVTYMNMQFYGASSAGSFTFGYSGETGVGDCSNVTVTGCTFGYSLQAGITTNSVLCDVVDATISGNSFMDTNSGTYPICVGQSFDRWTISDNYFWTGPVDYAFSSTDRHAMGGQSVSNATWEQNHIGVKPDGTKVGWSGDFYIMYGVFASSTYFPQINNIIRYNEFWHLGTITASSQSYGIMQHGDNNAGFVAANAGWQIYYNLIVGLPGGGTAGDAGGSGAAIWIKGGAATQVYNNSVYNCRIGSYWTTTGTVGETQIAVIEKNNLFGDLRTGGFHKYFRALTGTNSYAASNNRYVGDTSGADNLFRWNNSNSTNFADWQSDSTEDANSSILAANPWTDTTPDTSADFILATATGVANAGASLGLTRDYSGNTIRGAPDIGGMEKFGGLPGGIVLWID